MSSIIYFEVDNALYGVEAGDLMSVGSECPAVSYPGLQSNVSAVVLWGGQVFPVYDHFKVGKENFKFCVFLFTKKFAVPVQSRLKVAKVAPQGHLNHKKSHAKRLTPGVLQKYSVQLDNNETVTVLEFTENEKSAA